MQIKKGPIVILLALVAAVAVAAYMVVEFPGAYARHILKKSEIELSSKEFVDGACREDIGTIVLMLDAGIDVNIQAQDERRNNTLTSALHCAASKGNIKLINLLLKRGASVELPNQLKETPLIAAVSAFPRNSGASNMDIINLLLAKGAQINAQSENGTALHAACRSGNMNMVNFLLDHGANPALTDSKGVPPLGVCTGNMYNGNEVPFEKLLVKGVSIDAQDQGGSTLLSRAVQAGNMKLIEKLLSLGANPNATDRSGDSPLIYAIRYPELMEMLINKGADVNLKGKDGSALLAAIRSQSMPTVGLLLSKGADPKVADSQGNTPLHLAAQSMNTISAIKMLITSGASPNAANLEGNTPLHLAVRNHNTAAIDMLLANGARVNEKNFAGQTPLSLAKGNQMQIGMIPIISTNAQGARQILTSPSSPPSEIEKNLIRHGGKL